MADLDGMEKRLTDIEKGFDKTNRTLKDVVDSVSDTVSSVEEISKDVGKLVSNSNKEDKRREKESKQKRSKKRSYDNSNEERASKRRRKSESKLEREEKRAIKKISDEVKFATAEVRSLYEAGSNGFESAYDFLRQIDESTGSWTEKRKLFNGLNGSLESASEAISQLEETLEFGEDIAESVREDAEDALTRARDTYRKLSKFTDRRYKTFLEDSEDKTDVFLDTIYDRLENFSREVRDWAEAFNVQKIADSINSVGVLDTDAINGYVDNRRKIRALTSDSFDMSGFDEAVSSSTDRLVSYSRNEMGELYTDIFTNFAMRNSEEISMFVGEAASAMKVLGVGIDSYENLVWAGLDNGNLPEMMTSVNNMAMSLAQNEDLYVDAASLLGKLNDQVSDIRGLTMGDSKKTAKMLKSIASIEALEQSAALSGVTKTSEMLVNWQGMAQVERWNDEQYMFFRSVTGLTDEYISTMLENNPNQLVLDFKEALQGMSESTMYVYGQEFGMNVSDMLSIANGDIEETIKAIEQSQESSDRLTDSGVSTMIDAQKEITSPIDALKNELSNSWPMKGAEKLFGWMNLSITDIAFGVNVISALLGKDGLVKSVVSTFPKLKGVFTSGIGKVLGGKLSGLMGGKLGSAGMGMFSGAGLKILGGIGGGLWTVIDGLKGMKNSTDWLGEDKGNSLSGKVSSFIGGALGGNKDGIFGGLSGAAKGALIGTMFGPVGTVVGGAVGGILGAVGGKRITKFVKGTWDKIKGFGESTWDGIKGFGESAWNLFKENTVGKWETFKESASDSWETFKTESSTKLEEFKNKGVEKWEEIKSVGESALEVFSSVGSTFGDTVNGIFETIDSITSGLNEGISDVLGSAWDKVTELGGQVLDKVEEVPVIGPAVTKAEEVLTDTSAKISDATESLTSRLEENPYISTALDKIDTLSNSALDYIEGVPVLGGFVMFTEDLLDTERSKARNENIDGSHASGASFIPYDGYIAELHRGERVLTAGENREYSNLLRGSSEIDFSGFKPVFNLSGNLSDLVDTLDSKYREDNKRERRLSRELEENGIFGETLTKSSSLRKFLKGILGINGKESIFDKLTNSFKSLGGGSSSGGFSGGGTSFGGNRTGGGTGRVVTGSQEARNSQNQRILSGESTGLQGALDWARMIAYDDRYGYSQASRWGEQFTYDCSSYVISAFKDAGFDVGNATYTGNMKENFVNGGFTWIPWSEIGDVSNLKEGDILLNEKDHTEIYAGNGKNLGARSGKVEQGRQIREDDYWYDNWDGILRWEGPDLSDEFSNAMQGISDTSAEALKMEQGYLRKMNAGVQETAKSSLSSIDSVVSMTGNTSQDIWNYLTGLGFNEQSAAAILGTWNAESNVNPDRVEGDYLGAYSSNVRESADSLEDWTQRLFNIYTNDNIKINRDAYKDSSGNYVPGLGLAQWTGIRAGNLLDYADSTGQNWYDLGTQLGFFTDEIMNGSYQGLMSKMNAASSVDEATSIFYKDFEGGTRSDWLVARQDYADDFYNTFGSNVSYDVGTPMVPEDQVALVHEGEMIVPANQNPMNDPTINMPIQSNNSSSDTSGIIETMKWQVYALSAKLDALIAVSGNNARRQVDTGMIDRFASAQGY